jgi:hypothetical protein
LVPVNNLPIIFYILQKFKDSEFIIIADYKTDVLLKYFNVFACKYNYKIIKSNEKGTASGIKDAIKNFSGIEPFMIIWCDLILSGDFKIPCKAGNYLGISKDFECRWSYVDDEFIKKPSKENGVAGLFIFENKFCLQDVPESGAFVNWLKKKKYKI